jgi:hypothetical protein
VNGVDRVYAILPFVVLVVLGAAFVFVFRERAAARRARTERRIVESDVSTPLRNVVASQRRWWWSPWPWAAVCVAAIVLGYIVWPGLYAVPALLLPVAWLGRPRRERPIDPRANGHAKRDGPGSLAR